jgi:orotidine-5'-phosphate decarboxylase
MKNIRSNDLKQGAVDRLIFALDVGTGLPEALSWVDRLQDHVGLFKVGKESFTLYGPEIVRQILCRGSRVFLDLKFHDIPNTVARAAEGAVDLDVSMFNIHALGGKKMMEETVAAVRRRSEALNKPMPVILAVTVLTSLNDEDLRGLRTRWY